MPAEPFIGRFPSGEAFLPQVLYFIERNGDLVSRMNHHAGQGGGSTRWDGLRNVGPGGDGAMAVFSGGGVAIYVVRPDGVRMWYGHVGGQTGPWIGRDPPRQVGTGWQ